MKKYICDQFKIREFTVDDYCEVVELLQEISNFQEKILNNNFINQANYFSCVAVDGDRIVAFGSIFTYYRVRGGHAAVIEDMVVKKNYRGRGVGLLILNVLLKYAKSMNCFKVSLESSEGASNFYANSGFIFGAVSMKIIL